MINFDILGCCIITQRDAKPSSKHCQHIAIFDLVQENADQLAATYSGKVYNNCNDMLANVTIIKVLTDYAFMAVFYEQAKKWKWLV